MFRAGPRILRAVDMQKAATFSVARILSKGIIYGGLGGGLLGLAIELSPEEAGLRSKAQELAQWAASIVRILEGKELVSNAVATVPAPAAAPPAPKVEVIVPPAEKSKEDPQSEKPVVVKVVSEPVVAEQPPKKEEVHDTRPEHPPVEQKQTNMESLHTDTPSKEEHIEEPPKADDKPPTSEQPPSQEEEPEKAIPLDPVSSHESDTQPATSDFQETISSLKEQIESLQSEVSDLHSEADLQHQRQAGADQATIETMDRLFSERQRALSLARQSLSVLMLLEEVVEDKKGISPVALRSDFNTAARKLIRACFAPENPSMGSALVANLFAQLYSIEAGETLRRIPGRMEASETWKRLGALQRARAAVETGDFANACMHLHALEACEDAKNWTDKARTAAQVYHSAVAAVAQMYDDLSRIMDS